MLPFAEQCADRHAEMLAEQIEQRRLYRRHRMDRRAQVERLLATPARIAIAERGAHALQHLLHMADGAADDEITRILQRLPDLLAAGHFADAGAARAVGQDSQIAREERTVRAAQVQQHAVAAGHWDDAQLSNDGG